MNTQEKLLTRQELADALGRHVNYVSAMKRAGFSENFGNRYFLSAALAWLSENKNFRTTKKCLKTSHRRAKSNAN